MSAFLTRTSSDAAADSTGGRPRVDAQAETVDRAEQAIGAMERSGLVSPMAALSTASIAPYP